MIERMREIVLDTETTGLDPGSGHRLVEIACVEILNLTQTGATFHAYLNPQRDMPIEAFNVHGLSAEFLSTKPLFRDTAKDFLLFISDARLVIHNAEFDVRFLNAELTSLGLPALNMHRVVDTLAIARKKHPGASNSLDALCARYKVNNSRRVKHGALTDAELLAEVYAELTGGRQTSLTLTMSMSKTAAVSSARQGQRLSLLPTTVSDEEMGAHLQFVEAMSKNSVWGDYMDCG